MARGMSWTRHCRLLLVLGTLLLCFLQFLIGSGYFDVSAVRLRGHSSVHPSNAVLTWGQLGIFTLWSALSIVGVRHLQPIVVTLLPQYADTVFFFSGGGNTRLSGQVALTIDDGICRQDSSHSMLAEVMALLHNHSAHVTSPLG